MNQFDLERTASLCRVLAEQAGDLILKYYHSAASVTTKVDGSPLTQADEAANTLIIDGLNREYPNTAVLSEESPDDLKRLSSDWCFLVDPLDGTKEFLSRNGEFTVNIALIFRGRPVVGVIVAPALRKSFYAFQGGGAWSVSGSAVPVRLACGAVQVPPRLAVSRSHRSQEEDRFIEGHGVKIVVPMGSSLKGCLVASGEVDLYLRAGTVMEWDIAAMHAIVNEAGGRVVRWSAPSEPIRYNERPDARVSGFACGTEESLTQFY